CNLHLLVIEPNAAQQLDATHFHPDEEVCVIDDAHLIGFGVAHSQANFMCAAACLRAVRHQRRLHCGLRFSRKAVMPSRKSGVCRMRAFSSTAASSLRSSSSFTVCAKSSLVARRELGLFCISVCAIS